MDELYRKIGRILFAVPFLVFGFMHFPAAGQMAGMVPSFIPGGVIWIYITGLCMLAAGVSIVIEKRDKLATQLLAALLAIYILTVHLPGLGGAGAQYALMALLKDLGLLGGALVISSISKK